MRKYSKILILAFVFSFLWGLWWGFYSLEKRKPLTQKGPPVRWLTKEGLLSSEMIKRLEAKAGVGLQVVEKKSDLGVLREALSRNNEYDLIYIHSGVSNSFILDNVFSPLDYEEIPNAEEISIDFKNLDFDPENKYLVPIAWGLNGFLVNGERVSAPSETLSELVNIKSKISFIPSPMELYHLIVKLKPIIKTWVETGQTEELFNDLKDIKAQVAFLSEDPRDLMSKEELYVAQITNGQAAKMVGSGSKFRFLLPKERGTLWLALIGVSRGAHDKIKAMRVLNTILDSDLNRHFVEVSEQASVLTNLNDSSLPMMQKASFIRQVPLSRVELFIQHEAFEPMWMQALSKEWPGQFSKSVD